MKPFMKQAVTIALAAVLALPAAAGAAADKDQVLLSASTYEVYTYSGTGELNYIDGLNTAAAFRGPTALTALPNGDLLVADTGNQRIRLVTATNATTRSGLDLGEDGRGFLIGALNDGNAQQSAFSGPAGLTLDKNNNLIVADSENHAIRSVSPLGETVTIAGNGLFGLKDGSASEALFYSPEDVAVAADGTIYVADTLNHVIRKIVDGTVTTLNAVSDRIVEYYPGVVEPAGDYADGLIASAKFNEPSGLALDTYGNLYVSDTGNQRIRYIDFTAGTVSTVAGAAKVSYGAAEVYAEGGYADGEAGQAAFRAPRGLAVTADGGLLIADSLNHVVRYLKDGKVSTVAGKPEESGRVNGVVATAGLNKPTDVAWLGDGAFAISDTGNNVIRIVRPYEYPTALQANGSVQLVFNKEILASDVDPIIKKGTTFVPVRVIADKLGYTVDYKNRVASVAFGDITYTMEQDVAAVTKMVSGSESTTIALNAAPFISEGRLYLPVRFLAEEMGLDVQWLADVKTVLLRDPILQ